MYKVVDYYENPFGECLYVTKDLVDAEKFATEFKEDTDFECDLKVLPV